MTARDDAMEEMRKALQPFATLAAVYSSQRDLEWLATSSHHTEHGVRILAFTVGDLRRAAKALASAQEKGEANGKQE